MLAATQLVSFGSKLSYAPYVFSTATTPSNSNASITVNLPSGIQSGNLLFAIAKQASGITFTTPTGWTQLFSQTGGGPYMWAYYKYADGTEGSTMTVTASSGQTNSWAVYCIRNALGAPVYGTFVGNSGTTVDPPSLTSGFPNRTPTLWIAAMISNSAGALVSYPSGWSNGIVSDTSTTLAALATLQSTNASENPGVFTRTGSTAGLATTLAIRGPA